MMAETAFVNAGFNVAQPTEFAQRMYALLKVSMGIDKDA